MIQNVSLNRNTNFNGIGQTVVAAEGKLTRTKMDPIRQAMFLDEVVKDAAQAKFKAHGNNKVTENGCEFVNNPNYTAYTMQNGDTLALTYKPNMDQVDISRANQNSASILQIHGGDSLMAKAKALYASLTSKGE